MRLSKYVSVVENYPEPGQHLAFHWMTQAMAVMDDEVREITLAESFSQGDLHPDIAQQFESTGMMIADDVDERAEAVAWHARVKEATKKTFKAMVMTTYECNFACTYCVEEGVKGPTKLDDAAAHRTVQWVIDRLQEQGSTKLYLNFYGGEPLLNVGGLEQVAGPLLRYTQEQGLEFEGSVTTNGALLNRRVAQRLVAVGITRAKVTVDGHRESHDEQRPFKGGHGSFDIIMANIQKVWDVIDVRLASNLDCHSVNAVPQLIEYLHEQGLDERIDGLHFGGISGQARDGFEAGDLLQVAPVGAEDTSSQISDDMQLALLEANQLAGAKGLPIRKPIGASLCLLNQGENAVVIDPLGAVYKCPALVGHEAFAVGSVESGELALDHLRMYDDEKSECMDCKWSPVCGGGCRFQSFMSTGDIRHKDCHKSFYDTHGDNMVQAEYETWTLEQAQKT